MTTLLTDPSEESIPEEDGAPLSWALWLRLYTKSILRDPEQRATLLAGEDIDLARWNEGDRYWHLVLAERLKKRDRRLAERVAVACAGEAPKPMPHRRKGSRW